MPVSMACGEAGEEESEEMMEEFFIVAARRTEGLPKLSKSVGDDIYFTAEEAMRCIESMTSIPEYSSRSIWAIFRCEGRVIEEFKDGD